MAEGVHVPSTAEEVVSLNANHKENYDPSNVDQNTCFLCCMRFTSVTQCRKHQHHVHMRWVPKGSIDYSDGDPEEPETEHAIQEIQPVLDPASIITNLEQFESHMEGQQIFAQRASETSEGEQAVTVSIKEDFQDKEVFDALDMGKEYKRLGEFDIALDELPDDKELAEIGFPSKIGHFCHQCDAVIKSYRLYYLHMHNLHQLEKRFQCIISACGKTFTQTLSFQKHEHNQKSDHYCSMCDNVFADDEELQDHLISSDHATKYMQVQEKYNRTEPRNHRCKVCHSWFGLFATFVKHMETESHSYQCRECGLLFVQPGPRRNHIQSVHPDVANTCEICGLKLGNSQALWTHLSIHNIVHECPKCHRRFLQKEQLVAHSEVHAPPTPCPWEGCNRKLATKVGLFNHLRMHRGDTDFKCSVCSKGFFKKKTLETHMKVHDERLIRGRKEDIQEEAAPTEVIQLVCAGCMRPFDSEDHFQAHACTSQATTDDQGQVVVTTGQSVFGDDNHHIIVQTAGNGTESLDADQLVAHEALANSLNMSSQEFAEQLARVVAEAGGPGGQVTVSIAPKEPGTVSVSIPEFEDAVEETVFNQDENTIITAQQLVDVVGQQIDQKEEVVKEDAPVEQIFAIDSENQQVFTPTVEESLPSEAFPGESSQPAEEFVTLDKDSLEQTIEMETKSEEENTQIVMMVSEDGESQQVPIQLAGDQAFTSAAVLKIPTGDGGHQMLIIPINSNESGNTVLTLPQGFTLGGEDSGDITLALEPGSLDGDTLQVMAPDGQINIESLLQNANITTETLPQE